MIHDRPGPVPAVNPEGFYLNVTDSTGYTVSYRAEGSSVYGGYEIASVSVAMHDVAHPRPVELSRGTLARGGVVSLTLLSWGHVFHETGKTYDDDTVVEETDLVVPTTTVEGEFTTPDGHELTLPRGEIYETYAGYHRGFGWEDIAETTSLTQAAIGHAIENADDVIHEDGAVRYVIGDGISAIEKAILSIIGGTAVAASHSPAYNDDCGATIRIDQGENPAHSIRDGKPIDDVTTLIDVLENPTRIVDRT